MIQNLSSEILVRNLKTLVCDERKLLSQILAYLYEVEERRLFLDFNCSSLFEFCMKVLSYSEGAAQRRISAMRLVYALPEEEKGALTDKIESGVLSLTVLAQAQQFFNQERKVNSKKYSSAEKLKVLEKLEGKSKRETERELAIISPAAVIPKEVLKPISESRAKLELVIDFGLQEKLERIKDLMSHSIPNPTYVELLNQMADLVLLNIDPLKKESRRQNIADGEKIASSLEHIEGKNLTIEPHLLPPPPVAVGGAAIKLLHKIPKISTSAKENCEIGKDIESFKAQKVQSEQNQLLLPPLETLRSRALDIAEKNKSATLRKLQLTKPTNLKAQQALEDKELLRLQMGARRSRYIPQAVKLQVWKRDAGQCTFCSSKRFIQIDHIHEFAKGGTSLNPNNLRLLCGAHNRARSGDRI